MGSDSARHILQNRGPGKLKHIEIRCLAMHQWIRERERRLSKHLDGLRTRSLSRKLGLQVMRGTDDREHVNSASSGAGVSGFSVSTGDRMSTEETLTSVHQLLFSFFLLQLVHRQTQISCTTHSRFSVHPLLDRYRP